MAAPTSRPTSVFISYSRTDSATIDRLEAALIRYGFHTWVDRAHLEGGDKWLAQIERAIQASDVVVVGLSPDAIGSPWVNKELLYSQQLGKAIIPVMLRHIEHIPLLLVELQYIDMQADESQGLQKLRQRLMRLGEHPDALMVHFAPAPSQSGSGGSETVEDDWDEDDFDDDNFDDDWEEDEPPPSPAPQRGGQPATPNYSPGWGGRPAEQQSWNAPPTTPRSWGDPPAPLWGQQSLQQQSGPRLVVSEGKEPGHVYSIRKNRVTIGRSRYSDIVLDDLLVSRTHTTIIRQLDGRYLLRDENSANGMTVNSQRVSGHTLEDGDKIKIGQTLFIFYDS